MVGPRPGQPLHTVPSAWAWDWWLSPTRCGLQVGAASRKEEGEWRCHLADTQQQPVRWDKQSFNKTNISADSDERVLRVLVWEPAGVRVLVGGAENLTTAVIAGTDLEVSCVATPPGHPPPNITILEEGREVGVECTELCYSHVACGNIDDLRCIS